MGEEREDKSCCRRRNGRPLLPNGLPDFVAKAPDGTEPPATGLSGLLSLPYPRHSDQLIRAALRLNGVGVRGKHRRKRLCTAGLDDGCEFEKSSYQVVNRGADGYLVAHHWKWGASVFGSGSMAEQVDGVNVAGFTVLVTGDHNAPNRTGSSILPLHCNLEPDFSS